MKAILPDGKPSHVDTLIFHKYTVGAMSLGYILQIADTFLLVSLPGGVVGILPLNEVSDTVYRMCNSSTSTTVKQKGSQLSKKPLTSDSSVPKLTDLISLSSPIKCYVREVDLGDTTTGKRKTIHLSMRSSYLNRGIALRHLSKGFQISGCISSKEDHGYIVFTGISGITCFLPFQTTKSQSKNKMNDVENMESEVVEKSNDNEFFIGQPVDCIVDGINEASRSVTLRANRKSVINVLTNTLIPFDSLLPGMKVLVTVDTVTQVRWNV